MMLRRVVINESMSSWMEVKSRVQHGALLGPLLFVNHVNDIKAELSSTISLFVDDCAICHELPSTEDCEIFQNDLHLLCSWAPKS